MKQYWQTVSVILTTKVHPTFLVWYTSEIFYFDWYM